MAVDLDYDEEAKLDMTPMIDCVFQLLIFFMIVTDLTKQQTPDLVLPTVPNAVVEKPPRDLLILNVVPRPSDRDKCDIFLATRKLTEPELEGILKEEAKLSETREQLSDQEVLIRGDENARYGEVQLIMWHCQMTNPPIYKVKFGCAPLEEE